MAKQAKQVPLMLTAVMCLMICLRCYEALPNDIPDVLYEFGTSEGDLIAPVSVDGGVQIITSAQFPFFDTGNAVTPYAKPPQNLCRNQRGNLATSTASSPPHNQPELRLI